jgi:hypothetical protein
MTTIVTPLGPMFFWRTGVDDRVLLDVERFRKNVRRSVTDDRRATAVELVLEFNSIDRFI